MEIVGRPPTIQPLSEKIPSVIGPGECTTSLTPIAGVISEFAFPAG